MKERLDRFMARANAEYYAGRDPFADFTTAPEISQVFGELLGAWSAIAWEGLGRPDPVMLVELGPGRGTLMRDALRAVGQVAPGFRAALRLHLVETSPRLRAGQAALLPGASWHDGVDTLPDGAAIVLGNEFLDALPIRQFVRRGAGWTERWVCDGAFAEEPSPMPDGWPPDGVPPTRGPDLPDGAVLEVNEGARAVAAWCARRGATALFLDYGPDSGGPGESLQAIRDGRPADPLRDPGHADLTAHVDFAALAHAARSAGAAVHGPVPQGMFLARLGLFQRTGQLARGRLTRGEGPERAAVLVQAAQRLAEPARMGRLFKAMAFCAPGCPAPPGFSDEGPGL